jgi:tRNA (mo5U34)-methyltransferase
MDLMRPEGQTRARLLAQVAKLKWIHTIDLGDGVSTPGTWGKLNPCIRQAFDAIDFRGKKVLDIGCWDGYYSFEAEKRGAAEVYATDLVTQRKWLEQPTLLLAKKILGSRVKYFPKMSVYDVERLGIRDFDIVIYAGVYYHLKDPLRSFTTLRRVMKEGGTMLVEGAVIDSEDCYARFYYREPYVLDHSNWWVPTVGCLRQWIECSFLEGEQDFGLWDAGHNNVRFTTKVRAVRRADRHYLRADHDLAAFDLNSYPDASSTSEDPSPLAVRIGRRAVRHYPMSLFAGPNTNLRRRLKRWAEAMTSGKGSRS